MTKKNARPAASPQILRETLGIHIEPDMLILALTHRSFAHEAGGIPTNERLEFLGDSVLGIVVTEALYRRHPESPEGDLARMRAATVSQRALSEVARTLGLGEYILLGRGEQRTGGADKDSILSDTVEALIGAVFLSHGIETARTFVHSLVDPLLAEAANLGAGLDWKTSLQEACARAGLGSPRYVSTSEGPDHDREFVTTVFVGDAGLGEGRGRAKKHAEQIAAQEAYGALTAHAATPPDSPDEGRSA